MIGSVSCIDLSLANIWHCWYTFRKGKKRTKELDIFSYHLEENLFKLRQDLVNGTYQHGTYKSFCLVDTKRRDISVASIRDRIVHRLLYDYLIPIFDPIFIYDAWSCRQNKGLLGAITRTQQVLKKYHDAFVWRCDITKFFDSMDQSVLKTAIKRKIQDPQALKIINSVIISYFTSDSETGVPIGNLTSQVFTNIYLHELDFYVLHKIKPLAYVRYGDDFIIVIKDLRHLQHYREHLTVFIDQTLKLTIHSKNNIIIPVSRGIHFLGCDIFPTGRRLRKSVYNRIGNRLNLINCSSYRALVLTHSKKNMIKWLDWSILDLMIREL